MFFYVFFFSFDLSSGVETTFQEMCLNSLVLTFARKHKHATVHVVFWKWW